MASKVIRVDLASGATDLHVNKRGTLLSQSACSLVTALLGKERAA